jgi:hypothetical protein
MTEQCVAQLLGWFFYIITVCKLTEKKIYLHYWISAEIFKFLAKITTAGNALFKLYFSRVIALPFVKNGDIFDYFFGIHGVIAWK